VTKLLTADQVEQYSHDGFVAPIRVLSEDAATELRRRLEEHESGTGDPLKGGLRHKTHLVFSWLADLVRDETVLDAMEDLLGPDLLCWTSTFFIKEANDPGFVSWHQDSTYWSLSTPDVATAWIALTDSNEENGAMSVIPGSHLLDQLPHRDTYSPHNLLSRGQEVEVGVDPSAAVRLDLRPGEMSLHHVRIIHGSAPNQSDDRRIGFAMRYIPTHVRQLAGPDSASLVRGVDRHANFDLEPRATSDLDPEMVALHQRIAEQNAKILYQGTKINSYDNPGDGSAARFR